MLNSKVANLGQVHLPAFRPERLYQHPIDLAKDIVLPEKFSHWTDAVGQMIEQSGVRSGIAYVMVDSKVVEAGTTHRRPRAHIDGNYFHEIRAHGEGSSGPNGEYIGHVGSISREEWEERNRRNRPKTDLGGHSSSWPNWPTSGHMSTAGVWDAPGPGWGPGKEPVLHGHGSGGHSTSGHRMSAGKVYRHGETIYSPDERWVVNDNAGGGIIMVSNVIGCRGWIGDIEGDPLVGGDCEHLREALDQCEQIILQPNQSYYGNIAFVHESVPILETVERSLLRLTMPHNAKFLH